MILTFDIGTTSLKGALIREDGEFLSRHTLKISLPEGRAFGPTEADPESWVRDIKKMIPGLIREGEHKAGRSDKIRAVVISGNGPTLVPVDRKGEVLHPVMNWLDRRGTEQSKRITGMTGFYLDPTFYLPKALWLQDNAPEVYEKTEHFLSCPEYVIYRLTGEVLTVLPGEDFEKYFWTPDLLTALNLEQEKFPAFEPPGTIAGRVQKEAAVAFCLPENTPVIAAGPDFIPSILGTASVRPGRACDRAGTSEGINLCTEKSINDTRLMSYGHVIKPYRNLSGIISASGRALEWAESVLKADRQMVEDCSPGADNLLFLPYLAGERAPLWEPKARGAFIGLGLNHGASHMIRAVMESTGFAIRHVIETMEETGCPVEDLRITGGPARNDLWNRMKADITGRRILVTESPDPELTGNLISGLHSLGDFTDLAEAAEKTVCIKEIFSPDVENRNLYGDLFSAYKESYGGLRAVFSKLS